MVAAGGLGIGMRKPDLLWITTSTVAGLQMLLAGGHTAISFRQNLIRLCEHAPDAC